MLKRILIPTLASLALAGAVAMVGTAQDAAAEGGEGTLVWGMPAETDILDPHATGGWLTYDVTNQIFESFAKEDLTDPNAATPELIRRSQRAGKSRKTVSNTRSICARASSSTTARRSMRP